MKGNLNIQKLFIDLPSDKGRMLNFLRAKNFISAFQNNFEFDNKRSYEFSPGVRLVKRKNNKIGEETLSIDQQIKQEMEKIKKDEINIQEMANFGSFRPKPKIGKIRSYNSKRYNTFNEGQNSFDRINSLGKNREKYKYRLPYPIYSDYDRKLNDSNSKIEKLPLIQKDIGEKKVVNFHSQNLVIHKSDINKLIPDVCKKETNSKYELYDLNDKYYEYKKKPFSF